MACGERAARQSSRDGAAVGETGARRGLELGFGCERVGECKAHSIDWLGRAVASRGGAGGSSGFWQHDDQVGRWPDG